MCAVELDYSEAKLFKIRPILSHLNNKFQDLFYTPAQNIALDESLLMWKDYLDWGDSSDDNFDPEDCDTSSDDEEEAEDRRLITENAALDFVPLLQSQTSSESIQAEGATSAAEISSSAWCTSGQTH
ncbi:unnamed protein product [Colias eurytheme]|nr:unnamed protein product [Colias eurytheme]